MKKNLLLMEDLSREDVEKIIDISMMLKTLHNLGFKKTEYLKNKFFLLLFEKPSTRTRLSFEVAITQLGGRFSTLNASDTQLSRGEPIKDFARVVSRYVDGIIARVKKHESLEELARYSAVPVINALSDREHPVQVLADVMTIKEKLGHVSGVNLAFIGDGQDNVLNSLMIAAGLLGINLYIATPRELWPNENYLLKAIKLAELSGGSINITTNPIEAVKEADIIYTDVWVSMGREEEADYRRKILRPYQVNMELLMKSNRKPLVMHCLPAIRGEEITDEVIESPQSIVFDQAENRLHVQKGLLYYLFSSHS
jgi:ornithine carbamoyltransferase